MSDLTPDQQVEINALASLPDDQIDTSDAPEMDRSGTNSTEERNFFKEYGLPDAEARFRVYKMFRGMYGEDKKRFPTFFEGYQLGYSEGPTLNELLELAIKATCYIAEAMPESDQETLAGCIFRLLPDIIFKNSKQEQEA